MTSKILWVLLCGISLTSCSGSDGDENTEDMASNGETEGDTDAAADGDADGDTDGDADGDTDGDTDTDTDADGDTDTDGDTDSDADGDTDADSDTAIEGSLPVIAGCPVFTEDDAWNVDISDAPVDAEWTADVLALAGDVNLHPDFGNWDDQEWGIPINIVPEDQTMYDMVFEWYEDESDPGPYPFPAPEDAKVEGGDAYICSGDCHLLTVQEGTCMLYESGNCRFEDDTWYCSGGAVFDMSQNSYGQRPMGWTSADAAGLSIAAGLIRYDEIVAGEINHAIRFTMPCTQSAYVAPASHYAVPGGCSDSPTHPPMGMRVRLRADFDISGFNDTAQIILRAMKRYGMILADNGSAFYFQAETNPGWNGDEQQLKDVPADAFEVIAPGPFGP